MPILGIPKEIKNLEKRVALVPSAVKSLCAQGAKILVEHNAGMQSGYADEAYVHAGAEIVPDAAALYAKADIIQKVKEPLPPEYGFLRRGQILFGFLHLASPENRPLVEALLRSKVTAIGYETLEKDGKLPLLGPMSEIAGALAAAYAAVLAAMNLTSEAQVPDKQLLGALEWTAVKFPEFHGLPVLKNVIIFGGGVAGSKALETALQLKAQVTVIEKNSARHDALKKMGAAVCLPEKISFDTVEGADILIGAVHVRGQRAFHILDQETLAKASLTRKKVIIDIAIDQGGNFPESRSTSYQHPIYFDSNQNMRFCVPNIPSLCGNGASQALSKAALPYSLVLFGDPRRALQEVPELAAAVNVSEGEVRISAIREAHQI